jgi:hypothetical protein
VLAYITPCNWLFHMFNTTFLTNKRALITMLWLFLRNLVACMRYMNLGAYVAAFSVHTGTYLSSSSYKLRLAYASLCFE